MMKHAILFLITVISISIVHSQKVVRYDLYVTDSLVNFTGKERKALAINGQLPAPTLHFTEGDTAEIHVINHLHHETSIHWHGLLLPNEQDGVPYLTTAPIKPHGSHIYRFPIRQSGTYWYHSHAMLQEQIGMYGAFIIHKKDEKKDHQEVLLLSDWSDEKPEQIERSLHHATDWYMIKKNAVQSYSEAIREGYLGQKFENEWKRMHAMDVSDVYYPRFFVNGSISDSARSYHKGDTVRLRIINGSSSTYFWLTFNGGKFRVVASDGAHVKAVEVDRFIIGVSETYDVEVVIPEDGVTYEVLATSEDRIGSASFFLGNGPHEEHEPMKRLKYFAGMKMMNNMMKLNGNMDDMGMDMSLQKMDMNFVMYPEISGPSKREKKKQGIEGSGRPEVRPVTLNYSMLEAPVSTALPDKPFRTLHFELTGNMNRYVWTVNNKTISESDKILIEKGENIRIVITNNSMMRHPMHLHGHFFRVLNGHGDRAPLKNVLDILPMETDTIEFNASEEYGDWYFHCHILYHMMSGMGRIFSYKDSPPNPQIPNPKKALRKVYHDDRRFYPGAEISLESNGSDGEVRFMNTRWLLETEWRVGITEAAGRESESHVGRYFGKNQFAMLYTGWDWRNRSEFDDEKNLFNQENTSDQRGVFCFGLRYTLPFWIQADARIDHAGNVRLQLKREDIPLTPRTRLWGMVNSDLEYSVGARYILTKYFALSSHYDSDMGLGAGVTVIY